MLDLIIPLKHAYAVYFAQPDALKVRHDSPEAGTDVRPHHSTKTCLRCLLCSTGCSEGKT